MALLTSKSFAPSQGSLAMNMPSLFFIKTLLYPVSIVALLIGSFVYWKTPLSGISFLLVVVVLIASIHVMDTVRLYREERRFPWLRSFLDILLRWLLILAVLWLIFDRSGFDYLIFEPAIQTWAVATPVMLFLLQVTVRFLLPYFF